MYSRCGPCPIWRCIIPHDGLIFYSLVFQFPSLNSLQQSTRNSQLRPRRSWLLLLPTFFWVSITTTQNACPLSDRPVPEDIPCWSSPQSLHLDSAWTQPSLTVNPKGIINIPRQFHTSQFQKTWWPPRIVKGVYPFWNPLTRAVKQQ